MSWQQIEDILFDGTEDDIKNLSCPECKTPIYYTYNKGAKSLKYGCKNAVFLSGQMVVLVSRIVIIISKAS